MRQVSLIPLLLSLLVPLGCYSGGGQGPTRLTAGSDACNTPMVLQAAVELYRAGGAYRGHTGAQRFTHSASFDCESYALYQADTLTLSSGMGIHLLRGPRFTALATGPGAPADANKNGSNLDEVHDAWMAKLVKLTKADPLAGTFPTIAEFHRGTPRYAGEVDLLRHDSDYTSLRWNRDEMNKVLTPQVLGRSLLAQLITAEGRLAVIREEWTLQGLEQFFGDLPAEGLKGLISLHAAWEKARFILENLAFDGSRLGSVDPDTYDPAKKALWFPARIRVEEEESTIPGIPPAVNNLTVTDGSSTLSGTVALLRGALELYWLAAANNPIQNYQELFDGDPFPKESDKESPARIGAGLVKVCLANLQALHYLPSSGTLVDTNLGGAPLRTLTTTNVAAALRALAEVEEVIPGVAGVKGMIKAQGEFLRSRLLQQGTGYAWDGWDLDRGPVGTADNLTSQLAAIDGLLACYVSLGEPDYLARALDLATVVERDHRIAAMDLLRSSRTSNTIVWTPATSAWLARAMRSVCLEGLYPGAADFYGRIHPAIFGYLKLLMAENELTGETIGDGNRDTDGDGIPETLQAGGTFGTAPIMAERRQLLYTTLPGGGTQKPVATTTVTWSQDILPLFSKYCSSCHMGVNNNGGLDLSTFTSAMRGGSSQSLYPSIVPYQATGSLLYLKLILDNPPVGTRMPYLAAFPLTPEESRLVRDWINQGAKEN